MTAPTFWLLSGTYGAFGTPFRDCVAHRAKAGYWVGIHGQEHFVTEERLTAKRELVLVYKDTGKVVEWW